jgi:hypothetical protein
MAARLAWRLLRQAETDAHLTGIIEGSGTIMKKVAVTALVLALGLAACNKAAENTAANETAVEANAATDVNVATENAGAETNADAALNAPSAETANTDANATENK